MLASWQNILFYFHKLVATHLKNLPPSIKVGIYGFCGNRKAIHVMLSASSKLFTFNHLFLKNFQNTKYELRTHKMTSNGFPCIIPPPIHAVIEYLFSTITMGRIMVENMNLGSAAACPYFNSITSSLMGNIPPCSLSQILSTMKISFT